MAVPARLVVVAVQTVIRPAKSPSTLARNAPPRKSSLVRFVFGLNLSPHRSVLEDGDAAGHDLGIQRGDLRQFARFVRRDLLGGHSGPSERGLAVDFQLTAVAADQIKAFAQGPPMRRPALVLPRRNASSSMASGLVRVGAVMVVRCSRVRFTGRGGC